MQFKKGKGNIENGKNDREGTTMLNTKELKNAMGELDEDIVTELLKAVMDDGGSEADQKWGGLKELRN